MNQFQLTQCAMISSEEKNSRVFTHGLLMKLGTICDLIIEVGICYLIKHQIEPRITHVFIDIYFIIEVY